MLFRTKVLAPLLLAVLAFMGAISPVSAEAANQTAQGEVQSSSQEEMDQDQIKRLYQAAFGRQPKQDGLDYWASALDGGWCLLEMAQQFVISPEFTTKYGSAVSDSNQVVNMYRNVLDRNPEPAGALYWQELNLSTAELLVAFSESKENITKTNTRLHVSPNSCTLSKVGWTTNEAKLLVVPSGWVSAGNGVYVPPILLSIRWCESRDSYVAANSRSSARGAYQFLSSSWAAYGHAERYGVPTADQAAPEQQDEAALITWMRAGTSPWAASRHCWG